VGKGWPFRKPKNDHDARSSMGKKMKKKSCIRAPIIVDVDRPLYRDHSFYAPG
jgi:hypothetical protein